MPMLYDFCHHTVRTGRIFKGSISEKKDTSPAMYCFSSDSIIFWMTESRDDKRSLLPKEVSYVASGRSPVTIQGR